MGSYNNNSMIMGLLKGDSVFIRFSASPDGTDFTTAWRSGQLYIGIATGGVAPQDKSGYMWCRFAGAAVSDNVDYDALVAEVTESVLSNLPIAEEVSV